MNILGVGAGLVDILVHIEEEFIIEHKLKKGDAILCPRKELNFMYSSIKSEYKIMPGGSVANTILGLAQLGYEDTNFVTCLGKDEFGKIFEKSFQEYIDNPLFSYTDSVETGTCLSLITPDGQRTMLTNLGASQKFYEEEFPIELLTGFTHLHLEAYSMFNQDFFYDLLKKAKEKKMTISLDLSSSFIVENFKESLPILLKNYIDIVLLNEEEGISFTGSTEVAENIYVLKDYCPIVAYKQGRKGSYLFMDEELSYHPAFSITDVVDSTGAGDMWAAGFLYGLNKKLPKEKILNLANFMGGETIRNVGAFLTKEQIILAKEQI